MSNFTLEDLYNYHRKGAGRLVDAYEQLQHERDKLAELVLTKQAEVDALAAALSLAKQMMHDYEMMVDCPAPTEHRHKMDKMYAALAEHDAGVARKAYIAGGNEVLFSVVTSEDGVVERANEYAERVKRGEI